MALCIAPEKGAIGVLFLINNTAQLEAFKSDAADADAYVAVIEASLMTSVRFLFFLPEEV